MSKRCSIWRWESLSLQCICKILQHFHFEKFDCHKYAQLCAIKMERKLAEKCAFVIWKISFVFKIGFINAWIYRKQSATWHKQMHTDVVLLPQTQNVKFIDKHSTVFAIYSYSNCWLVYNYTCWSQMPPSIFCAYFVYRTRNNVHICPYAAVASFSVHFISFDLCSYKIACY